MPPPCTEKGYLHCQGAGATALTQQQTRRIALQDTFNNLAENFVLRTDHLACAVASFAARTVKGLGADSAVCSA